jgi:hypothetical protein
MRTGIAGSYTGHFITTLKTVLLVLPLLALISGCALAAEKNEDQDGRFEFALIGDMPYDGKQEKEFVRLMQEVNAADLAFVVHAGDFWGDGAIWKETSTGYPPCGDETIQDRLQLARESRHPYILTPGDNDWTDCYRAKPRTYDPLERLTKLRKMFFQGDQSLGQHTLHLVRQSEDPRYAKFDENVRWSYGGVQFVTLHMVGSNNNLGRTPEMDAEYAERNAANLEWMRQAFELAKRNGRKAIMIFAQANPRFENTWSARYQGRYMLQGLGIKPPKEKHATGFDEFLAALEDETLAFGKPVVLAHGDTHTFRVDKPLVDFTNQQMIENFTRVETFGWPATHWVRVTIDPEDPNVFSFRQQIVRQNRSQH